MYTVWHVDRYKITFKLVINRWTNEILKHIVVSSGLSRPGVIDARAQYRAAARRLRNTGLDEVKGKVSSCSPGKRFAYPIAGGWVAPDQMFCPFCRKHKLLNLSEIDTRRRIRVRGSCHSAYPSVLRVLEHVDCYC